MMVQVQLFFVLVVCPLIYAQSRLIHSPNGMPFDNARNWCKGRGGNLIRVDSDKKRNTVTQYALANSLQWYWVDADDMNEESVWRDSDKNLITYRSWTNANQPNGGRNENCMIGYKNDNGQMEDYVCYKYYQVICENTKDVGTALNYVSTQEKMDYAAAVNYCGSRNLDLVIINNAEDNTKAFEYAKRLNLGTYWINGNDIRSEDYWVDTNKSRLRFRNFIVNEPNGGRGENCISAGYSDLETWSDVACTLKNAVICQPLTVA